MFKLMGKKIITILYLNIFLFFCLFKVTDAMMMINEGEVMSDSGAFVDTLMQEECLKTSQRPIILHLISSAISEGMSLLIL